MVTGPDGGPFDVEFKNTLSSTNVPQITAVTPTAADTATAVQGGGDAFTLSLNGQTTAPIPFTTAVDANTPDAPDIANINAIQTALNAKFGAGFVQVNRVAPNQYSVWFVGAYDVNENTMVSTITAGAAGSAVVRDATTNVANSFQAVDGDPTIPASFTQAFQSRNLNTNATKIDAILSPYVNGLSANDVADRVDELGAFAGTTPTKNNPIELVRFRVKAVLQSGENSFDQTFTPKLGTTQDADHPLGVPAPDGTIRPAHQILVYADAGLNESTLVSDDEVDLEPATIHITSGIINAVADQLSFNEDDPSAAARTVNVLANDTRNDGGSLSQLQVISITQPTSGGTVALATGSFPSNNGNLVFTPTPNFNGVATFTYTVGVQGGNVSDQKVATVSVNIAAVNDAPTIQVPAAQSLAEDPTTPKAITGITVADVDADAGGGLQVTLNVANGNLNVTAGGAANVTGSGTGSVTITGLVADVNSTLNTLTYAPTPNFSGSDSLVVNVNDQGHSPSGPLQASNTVGITISAVNDAPVVTAPASQAFPFISTLTFSTGNGNAITVNDVDAGTASIDVVLSVTGGVGTLHVTPASGVTISAGANDSAALTLTGPQAAINQTLNGMVLGNPPQTATSGTIVVTANDKGNTGSGGALTGTATIQIQVAPPVLPFAPNDVETFDEGAGPQTINILSKVLPHTGSSATLVSFTQPADIVIGGTHYTAQVALNDNGTAADHTDDKLVFTLPTDQNFFTATTPFTFTYTANDTAGTGQNTTGTITVNIRNIADPPVAVNDPDNVGGKYQGQTGQALNVTAANGVLINDTDVDNNYGATVATLTAIKDATGGPAHGTVVLNADGSFAYTPAAGFAGDDSFTYHAHSSLGPDSASATVSIHVAGPPTANPDTGFTATEDQTFTSATSVLANDTNPEPTTMTAVQDSDVPAAAGHVVLNADGTFTYTPAPNFNTTRGQTPPSGLPLSPITFTYHASAAGRNSTPTTVSITVNEVNDNPTAANDTFQAVKLNGTIGQNQPVSVLGNDSIAPDVGETLKVTGVGLSANGPFSSTVTTGLGGTVTVDSSGQILYTSPNATGSDSFFYQVSDFDAATSTARGGTASAKVDVTIVEFVPKSVSGTVFIDGNNNGNIDTGERPLSGVEVHLAGTDLFGAALTTPNPADTAHPFQYLIAITDAHGVFTFSSLKPPSATTSYTLTEMPPAFLLNGIDSSHGNALVTNAAPLDNLMTMRWGITDQSGDITGLTFAERGVDVGSLQDASGFINDYMSLSGPNGFVVDGNVAGKRRGASRYLAGRTPRP